MPADPIDRREAKEAIERVRRSISTQQYTDDAPSFADFKIKAAGIVLDYAQSALDKLPALDADGRWEKLRAWIQQVRDDWHHAGDMRKVFAADYILNEVSRVVSAPPAAERRPAVERPAMLYAKCEWNNDWRWWVRYESGEWASGSNAVIGGRASQHELDVDRAASDPAALALYDADLTSGDAANREGE